MKILHITETAAAGVGKHIADLACGQARAGHEVHVVYSPIRIDKYFEEKVAKDSVHSLLKTTACPIAKRLHWRDALVLAKLYRVLREEPRFDVIHGHSTKAGLLARLVSVISPGICVYTAHAPQTMNTEHGLYQRRAYEIYERLLATVTTRLIAVSEEERDHLCRLGIKQDKISVVHNGISPAETANEHRLGRLALRTKWQIPEDSICVGFLGRFVPQKDPELMIRSFFCLPVAIRSRVILVMAGSGPQQADLMDLAAQYGLTERIRWINGSDATPRAMCMFDVFALTSRYEGFPYVLLEAMTLGLPCVTTNVGGTQALIAEERNGFVIQRRTPEDFADKLLLLLQEQTLRAQQAEAGKRRARQFSVEAMVDATLLAYSRSMRGSSAFAPGSRPPSDMYRQKEGTK
jgi:glycosyltransferase involved in cell wall biosynthesis